MKTLRSQLFRSHLAVIAIALVMLMVATALFGGVALRVLHISGDDVFGFGRGRGRDGRMVRGRRGAAGPLILLAAFASAGLSAAWVARRLSRQIAQPIEDASTATRRIAAGDYAVRVDGGSITELSRLAGDVNELAEQLERTEQRRLHLLGEVAHELRTPLSTIEGSMEGLLDGVVPATPETFASVSREAARLRRLAGDLSSLSASSEATTLTTPVLVDFADVVAGVVRMLTIQAEGKGLQLTFASAGTSTVIGERDRLVQIATNVIGNAIRYTDQGSVNVFVEGTPSTVTCTVVDTGRGLAASDLARVFERFVRVDEHLSDGTGVGLTIAQSYARAHNGSIEAHSPGLGQGSTFTVTLPAASSQRA